MASKKTSPQKPTVNKSDFIRQQPSGLSAAEVIKKAKDAGIKLTAQLVYKVRGRSKTNAPQPKAMSATPTAAPGAGPAPKNKSAFIRRLPSSMPAKEVVKQAKAAGMKLTESYVYNVRGAAKKTARPGRNGASVARPITTTSSAEGLLKALAAELGLGNAIEILTGERTKVRAVIGR
jgi:hypothetical protein